MTTAVLVAHGSPALAEALSAVVTNEPQLEAVATASDTAEVLLAAGRIRPDAVLADLGDVEWGPALIALAEAYPQIRVVVLAPPGAPAADRLLAMGVHLVDATSAGIGPVLGALRTTGAHVEEPTGSGRP